MKERYEVKNMKKSAIILLIVVAVIVAIATSFIGIHNDLATKREAVDNALSNIDTNLQRRADLIPNLVSTVKGYVKHEDEVIEKITTAREHLVNAKSIEDKANAESELTNALQALVVVVENYPDLKSSENFINLQDELAGTENRIATSRRDYNDAVKTYNTAIVKFPANMIAGMFKFEKATYFEATEKANEVPTVDFSE
jgi:LemA protein